MMRVWEETWHADPETDEVYVGEGHKRMTFLDPTPGPPGDMPERALLAAAAPDLVRVLLAVEFAIDRFDDFGDRVCVACQEKEYQPHAPDCALDAALRKAGVR